VISYQHLLQQAKLLTSHIWQGESEPRAEDLRRAVSTAYYGVLHYILAQAVDTFFGAAASDPERYESAYRSVHHDWLRDLCDQVRGERHTKKVPHLPTSYFSDLQRFAINVVELQKNRESADYDPTFKITADFARIWVETAWFSIEMFDAAPEPQRIAFLALLLFDIRQMAQQKATPSTTAP
jgi:hypothetical protein